MRALRVTAPGEIAIERVKVPCTETVRPRQPGHRAVDAPGVDAPAVDAPAVDAPGPSVRALDDAVLIRPVLVGLCGTDLEILDGGIDPAYVRYPLTIGHEWVGRLVSTLPATESRPALPEGTMVVAEGILPCGECQSCRRGDSQLCDSYNEIGFTSDGAAAEFIAVPRDMVWAIDESVPLESAVVIEPAAVAWHAIALARPLVGDNILVIGDGTVGLLVARLARLTHPATVDLIGARAHQRPLAELAGVDSFRLIDPARQSDSRAPHNNTLSHHYDVVIVAVGAVSAVESAFSAVKRGGKIVLLGFPGAGKRLGIVLDDLVNNQIALLGSFAYTREDWRTVVEGLNSGAIDLAGLVTHRFELDEFSTAIDSLRSSAGMRGKVVLLP